MIELAQFQLDQVQTAQLDKLLLKSFGEVPPKTLEAKPIRLAIVGSSTLSHLSSSIRVGALRRGIWIEIYQAPYGSYLFELTAQNSDLKAFLPDAILISLDAPYITKEVKSDWDLSDLSTNLDKTLSHLKQCWLHANSICGHVIQQTFLPVFPSVFGQNEHRLPGSKAGFLTTLNARIRHEADTGNIDLLTIDSLALEIGVPNLYSPLFWHTGKQEIKPTAAPIYGDFLGRLLAAKQGLSAKCLVLDLDNTLWGGVIGDDGIDNIALGLGSPDGEAHLGLQQYAAEMAGRGVLLAICSKNNEKTALAAFDEHPEMLLRREDISSFRINWRDKVENISQIAEELNIGLNSLVFVDDNPYERELVRKYLPMVSVPELPDEPALFAKTIADAGYFEGIHFSTEDRNRTNLYKADRQRARSKEALLDMTDYLQSLQMVMNYNYLDQRNRKRVVQLINKTNQFNLTTRRYNDNDISKIENSPDVFGLHFRLQDRFGDNGLISVVICRKNTPDTATIDTWLMSCRVANRKLEEAILDALVLEAKRQGIDTYIGEYHPTKANDVVENHYLRLGFDNLLKSENGSSQWQYKINRHTQKNSLITIAKS